MIGTITAVVVAIYAGNWQADLLAQTGNPGFAPSTCGDGVCEPREADIVLCPPCAVETDGSPIGNCECIVQCPQDCSQRGGSAKAGSSTGNNDRCKPYDCKDKNGKQPPRCTADGFPINYLLDPCAPVCPSVLCSSPPEGCRYVPPYKKDNNGCQIGCGELVCEPKKPADRCAQMQCSHGCKNGQCIKPAAPEVCRYKQGVYQIGDQFKDDDGCNVCFCEKNGSVSCSDRACPVDNDGFYRYAKWECQDGKILKEGGPTSCKSRRTWKDYAYQACPNGIVDLETYESCNDDTDPPQSVLCLGKYKPGESFQAPDGCNKCLCNKNGQSACTKMFCPDKEPPPQSPRPRPNPNDPNDPDQECFSSQDCGGGTVCSVDFGDCMSTSSADVCVGFCMPKKLAYPDQLPKCQTSNDCALTEQCSADFGQDCLEECPLSDALCRVLCSGRCIPQDFDEQPDEQWEDEWDDGYEPDEYNEWHGEDQWDDHTELEYEDEVRTAPVVSRFRDIDLGTLESTAANALAELGVIGGFPDGTFRGNDPVNRAGAAKFLLLARYGTVPEASNDSLFIDLLRGEWYVKYVVRAAELGIISGYSDRTFRPANTVNTAEFLKMLSNAFGLPQDLAHNYSDVPDSAWFAKFAGVADVYELFPGRPKGDLQPDRLLSRGEVAIAIYKLMENQ